MNKLRKSTESTTPPDTALRQQAEEIAQEKAALMPENLEALSPEDARLLLHELRVHQIELEMQNEELRRTQSELEASRIRYFDLYDLAPVGYFTISELGLILEGNLTAAGLLGVSRSALVKRRLTAFVLPEDQDIYYQYRKQLFETGAPQVCEFRMLRANAAPFWVRMRATETQDADGAPVCRAVVSDITEIKRAEEALQESERRLSSIYDTVGDVIFHLAVEADGSYRFVSVNQAFRNVTGLSEEMVVGKLINEVIPEPSLSMVLGKYRRAIEENSIIRWEETSDYPTGRLVGDICIAPIVDDDGRCTHLVGSVHDITERKRAENVIQARSRLLEFADSHSMDELLTATLDELEALTGSTIGFYHFVESDQKTLCLQNWSTNTRKNMCTAAGKGSHYDVAEAGVWADCVGERRPIVHNDYVSLPHRKGMPEGHAPVVRELVVPVLRGNPIKAIIGVGNKSTNYNESDIEIVSQLGDLSWDITERKRAEEALIASEIRYRRLFESAKDGILILDAETGMVVDVNPFLIEMLGYSHEQFLGKTVWELSFLRDIVASKDNFERLQQEKYLRYDSLPFETFDGRRIEVEFVSNLYDVGDTKVIQCNIRDVTHRKRAVQALQESEQKLKATVYGSPIPQFVIDRDHRVVYWNKALEELTGRKTEEMVGSDNYWSAFYKERRPCMCDLLVDGNAGSIPDWYGAQYRRSRLVADAFEVTDFFPDLRDGGKWLFFTAATIKDSEGNVIGAMETLEDVTGRIKAEMEIHQLNSELEQRIVERTAQLQATNKELEAFSYSVSHDLRAPLRALDGFSRIVIEDYTSLLPEEAISHLNRIRAGALQMGRLIDDLLKFSRLGRQPLTKHSVMPGDLVQEVWEDLATERQGRKVKLSADEMPECQADPALLRQVYSNLLSNALKFTRRRETAIIEVGYTRAVESADTADIETIERTVYFVKDNGVGFDMQFADKLFGVFQRLHRPEEYEGTGVGLAIVHRVITRHGGRVWAHGELDKGATFYFALPPTQSAGSITMETPEDILLEQVVRGPSVANSGVAGEDT